MEKILRRYFNVSYSLHKFIYKKKILGMNLVYFLFLLLIIAASIFEKYKITTDTITYTILGYVFLCLLFFLLPFVQSLSLIFLKSIPKYKNDRIEKIYNGKRYLNYCITSTAVLTFSVIVIFQYVLKKEILLANSSLFLSFILISFSLHSIIWFSYLIIYKILSINTIIAKIKLYTTLLSTLNLLQFKNSKYFLISLGTIIVSYMWVDYLIAEKQKNKV